MLNIGLAVNPEPVEAEPTAVSVCSECGRDIYGWEYRYEIGGACYCEECIEAAKVPAI